MKQISIGVTRWIVGVSIALSLAGCASLDGPGMTRLMLPAVGADPSLVRVIVVADATYGVNSETAEKTRLDWLDDALVKNGYSKDYTIIQRDAVLRRSGLLGDIYDVYYSIRVHRAEGVAQ